MFSYVATVGAAISPGPVSISASVSDDHGRTTNAIIDLTVTDPTAAPVELLLTQYVEGSSYNKAIEIANLGSTAIDLSAYSIEVYSNANTTAGVTIALGGTLAPNDVYVVADDGADPAILRSLTRQRLPVFGTATTQSS